MTRADGIHRIDVHAHLAGAGAGGSGCWLSPGFRTRPTFRFLRRLYGIGDEQMRSSVDADWAARLAGLVRASELTHAVALGFDGVYDSAGRLDRTLSQMIVPPAWVFEVCRRHPELLPGPSVNPLRRDALERLDECIDGGAVLLKWLPAAQGMDPADPRFAEFYRRMADAGLPLLVHAGGGERVFRTVAAGEVGSVARLRAPLDAGVSVICAHSATRVLFSRDPDETPLLHQMLAEYPHLWVDNSGLANPSRFAHLPRLAADPAIASRTLYGSDFPVPASAVYYTRRLGPRAVVRLERERNPLDRDIRLKRALGYADTTLRRAAGVLPNLARWT
ncbi:amidohydrolase family protein [soil metagenome]